MTLEQSSVHLRTQRLLVERPVRRDGGVALARDVLDRQLVDVTGVQVVRAADAYLAKVPEGWELAGIDIGLRPLARRLLPRRRTCPSPGRVIEWADLRAFVPRFADPALPGPSGPATAAGTAGSGVQLGLPARKLHELRAREVAAIIADLGRRRIPPASFPALAAMTRREHISWTTTRATVIRTIKNSIRYPNCEPAFA